MQCDLEPCTHCPHSWARFLLALKSQVLKNISEQSNVKGIPNMLNGKNWPRAVRGFRMVSYGLVLIAMIDALHVDDNAK